MESVPYVGSSRILRPSLSPANDRAQPQLAAVQERPHAKRDFRLRAPCHHAAFARGLLFDEGRGNFNELGFLHAVAQAGG